MPLTIITAVVTLCGAIGALIVARRTGHEFREDTLYACVSIVVTYAVFNEYRRWRGPKHRDD